MELIKGYRVSASNNSHKQRGSITVKAPTGQIAARVYSEFTRPLQRARLYLNSPERHELVSQLTQAGVPQGTIEDIVSLKKGN